MYFILKKNQSLFNSIVVWYAKNEISIRFWFESGKSHLGNWIQKTICQKNTFQRVFFPIILSTEEFFNLLREIGLLLFKLENGPSVSQLFSSNKSLNAELSCSENEEAKVGIASDYFVAHTLKYWSLAIPQNWIKGLLINLDNFEDLRLFKRHMLF